MTPWRPWRRTTSSFTGAPELRWSASSAAWKWWLRSKARNLPSATPACGALRTRRRPTPTRPARSTAVSGCGQQRLPPGVVEADGMTEIRDAPPGVDPTHATTARLYDYFLGGSNNFPVDREVGEKLKA